MSKNIIFTEGENDLELIEDSTSETRDSVDIAKFVLEELGPATNYKGKESQAIRNFSEPYNPKNLLIKSEGGKPKLKSMFSTMVTQLDSLNIDFHIVIDLDGGDISDFCDDVNERCRERFVEDVAVEPRDYTTISTDIEIHSCSLIINSQPRLDFNVITFAHSMEICAGVTSSDSKIEKERKLSSLATSDELQDVLNHIF